MVENLRIVEAYAQDTMMIDGTPIDFQIGHDYKHADRVRRWALCIAHGEGYPDIYAVQIAALLHDIGLSRAKPRSLHGKIGAGMAEQFLIDNRLVNEQQLIDITNAIRYHCTIEQNKGLLLNIVRDADMLEMFGAVGLMRGFMSKATLPEYMPDNPRGDTWGMSNDDFTHRFVNGIGIGKTVIDQLNFQMSCYDNLATNTARQLAQPLIIFMEQFVEQLLAEVTQQL